MSRETSHWEKRNIYKITWDIYDQCMLSLYNSISEADFSPDIIIGIFRGGVFPAIKLSHMFSKSDIGMLNIKSNLNDDIYSESKTVKFFWSDIPEIKDAKVLIVDDIVGSGETLNASLNYLNSFHIKEARTCSIAVNRMATFYPEFYTFIADDWVLFPWENLSMKQNKLILKELTSDDIHKKLRG